MKFSTGTTLDVPPKQVQITAKIFEVSRDFDFQQGSEILLNRLASDGGQQLASTFSAKRFLDAASGPMAGAPVQGSVLKLMQNFSDAGVGVDEARSAPDREMQLVGCDPAQHQLAGQVDGARIAE